MSKQTINIGIKPNDSTGDTLRVTGTKINDNFDEVYNGTASVVRTTPPPTLKGATGDIAGMIAMDNGTVYVCSADYDGVTDIWTLSADHLLLSNIGTNDHAAIDTHIADTDVHYDQATIVITESQISDLGAYSTTAHDHDLTYSPIIHDHDTSHIISGTFDDARFAETNVTQFQASLSLTESQISDLGTYSTTSHNHDADYAPADARYVSKSANFTALNGGKYLINTSGGSFTINLIGPFTQGDHFYIADQEASFTANNISIGDASMTINGSAGPLVVTSNNDNFGLVWTGDEWKKI